MSTLPELDGVLPEFNGVLPELDGVLSERLDGVLPELSELDGVLPELDGVLSNPLSTLDFFTEPKESSILLCLFIASLLRGNLAAAA